MFADRDVIVVNDHSELSLELNVSSGELDDQSCLVDRLQKPRPESAMHVDGRTDDGACEVVDVF